MIQVAGRLSDCSLYLWRNCQVREKQSGEVTWEVLDESTVMTGPPYSWKPAALVMELVLRAHEGEPISLKVRSSPVQHKLRKQLQETHCRLVGTQGHL